MRRDTFNAVAILIALILCAGVCVTIGPDVYGVAREAIAAEAAIWEARDHARHAGENAENPYWLTDTSLATVWEDERKARAPIPAK